MSPTIQLDESVLENSRYDWDSTTGDLLIILPAPYNLVGRGENVEEAASDIFRQVYTQQSQSAA